MLKKIDALLVSTPNLKGREVAKKLGLPRKEINSLLHAHPERYVQNPGYGWSLVQRKKTLVLSGGWLSGDDFEDDYCSAGSLLDDPIDMVEIRWSDGCKPMIDAVAKILALANQLAHVGTVVILDFSASTKSLGYLNRAGFFDLLDKTITVLPHFPRTSAARIHKGNSPRLVEFECVEPLEENDDLKEKLANKFVGQTSSEYETVAFTIFGELIGNVKEHSESELWGFAASQKYAGNQDHIQAVVSDNGLGIASTLRQTLSEYHPSLFEAYGEPSPESDAALVAAAMSNGLVSRKGQGRGLGFYSSRQQATKFNAEFTVRQDSFLLRFVLADGKLRVAEPRMGLPRLGGTHICFDFFIG